MLLVDRLGRKVLLTASGAIMCISIIGLGTYFYLEENVKCNSTISATTLVNSPSDSSSSIHILGASKSSKIGYSIIIQCVYLE